MLKHFLDNFLYCVCAVPQWVCNGNSNLIKSIWQLQNDVRCKIMSGLIMLSSRPPFPLIGFRPHHNPMFPSLSLPIGFPPPRPFPQPPLPTAAAPDQSERGLLLTNQSGRGLLPPVASRPTSLFSVLSSAGAGGVGVSSSAPVTCCDGGERSEASSVKISHCQDNNMTLKNDVDNYEDEDDGGSDDV